MAGKTVEELARRMDTGDIIIDYGNADCCDNLQRAKAFKEKVIHYVDRGTSGAVFGIERGFRIMIDGKDQGVKHLILIFKSIAPGMTTSPRNPGKKIVPDFAEHRSLHCGPIGTRRFEPRGATWSMPLGSSPPAQAVWWA